METTEEIINITAESGTNYATETRRLNPGKIIGVMAYKSATDNNNPGFVSMNVKNSAGTEVSKLQHIDNYRSREAAYLDGVKPLSLEGGQSYKIEIQASANFTSDLLVQVIFVYEKTGDNCTI
ncbi:MAG TPA: hypothetical protein VF581_07750 [Flavobacterium sp.]|jgi:hypothetical protein